MSDKRRKVLIIKLGYSETLLPVVRQASSLGDVFRTTAILHLYEDDHVTWLTDPAAVPLLEDNPYIDCLLTLDLLSALRIESEQFDRVINFEKVPGICALANRINAWSKYGFRFDETSGTVQAYERAHEVLAIATIEDTKRLNSVPWLEVLFNSLGATWQGQDYILGYKPTSSVEYDIGFNTHVGELMPHKAWPMEHWRKLETLIGDRFTCVHQQHLNDLKKYMDWINTCRMLITNDSLGLYLGLALGKKVLGLFGPTPSSDHSPHDNLRILTSPAAPKSLPGFTDNVADDSCMRSLTPEAVHDAVVAWGID